MRTIVGRLACSMVFVAIGGCDPGRSAPDLGESADLLSLSRDLAAPRDLSARPDLTLVQDLASGCVPEVCNGLDDDCSGGTDEGCPVANGTISLTQGMSSPSFGNAGGGTAFTDTCAAGEVLVGIQASLGGSVNGVQGVCGKLFIAIDTSVNPYKFEVHIGSGTMLPMRGGSGTSALAMCPQDQAIVAISGHSGLLVDGFAIECAPLELSGAPGKFAVVQSATPTAQPYVGGMGGNPFARFACTIDQVVNVIGGSAGNSLDSLQLGCAKAKPDVK